MTPGSHYMINEKLKPQSWEIVKQVLAEKTKNCSLVNL